jgi:hypothetical protein
MPRISALLESTQQLGVGVPGGAEAIATAIRLYLEDPDDLDVGERLVHVIYTVDWVNAFNTVDRATVIQAVATEVPELLPFIRRAYGRDGRLVWSSRGKGDTAIRTFLSRTGVRQGDPLGPVLFALGYRVAMLKVLAAHPNALLPTFLDDTAILGGNTANSDVHASLVLEAAQVGLRPNGPKSFAYSGDCDVVAALLLPAAITASPAGVISLGVPVGLPAYVTQHARERLGPPLSQIRLLPAVNELQCSMLALRRSFVPRPRFLMASQSMEALAPVLAEWDAGISDAAATMLHVPELHPRCSVSGNGGLGLPKMVHEHAYTRVNGYDRSSRIIRRCFPSLAPLTTWDAATPTHPLHLEVRAAWASLPEEIKDNPAVTGPDRAAELDDKKALRARAALSSAYSDFRRADTFLQLDRLGQLLMAAPQRGAPPAGWTSSPPSRTAS